MSIADQEISVLVQGLIDEKTERCIQSITKWLPKAQIVISTWDNQVVPDDICGKVNAVVQMLDPGPVASGERPNNVNRQIIGRAKGLEFCEKPYTLIIRSDSEIVNLNFKECFENQPPKGQYQEANILDNRLVVCSAGKLENALFFLCDWYFFGLTADVKEFYNIPMLYIDENTDLTLPQFQTPHEYIGVSFVQKKMNSNYTYNEFDNKQYRAFWEKIIVENFVTLGFYKRYGIVNLKEPYYSNQMKNEGLAGIQHLMLNFEKEDWDKLYEIRYGHMLKGKRRIRWRLAYVLLKAYRLFHPICRTGEKL